jgi:predicted glycosyltransferase
MRLLVYSHDGFGLGNIRRMLAICTHLLQAIPQLSILVVSGSPMLHGFRLPNGLDYIKLPCLTRGNEGTLSSKYLRTSTNETVRLRSQLLLSTMLNFKPNVVLVDKKPYGMNQELKTAIDYAKVEHPETQFVLLLRDILDRPEATMRDWQQQQFHQAVGTDYQHVLVVGSPNVFDLRLEYQMPAEVAKKVRFCGYIRKPLGHTSPNQIRQSLDLAPQEKLVLVTPGGGEDGYTLIDTYLSGLSRWPAVDSLRGLVVCGPEMPAQHRVKLEQKAAQHPNVQLREFTDDLMSYMAAADAVVSMAGYNTTCEILSLGKRAVVVPRVKPSHEQQIRAERMAKLGLLQAIHPQDLTPETLMKTLFQQLSAPEPNLLSHQLDLGALPRIAQFIERLLTRQARFFSFNSLKPPIVIPAIAANL